MIRLIYGLTKFRYRWGLSAVIAGFVIGYTLGDTYGLKAVGLTLPWAFFLGHLAARTDFANEQRERRR